MGVSRNNEPKIVMNGWRGLNESFAPAHLRPGDLASVRNMDLRDGIALTTRLGQTNEHDRDYYPNLTGVRRILRYKSSTGVKKRLVLFGNNLRADTNDNKQYDDIVTIPGTPWMIQYYDIVLFGSDQQDMGVYDPIGGTVTYPNMDNISPIQNLFHMDTEYDNGNLSDDWYVYRFTYEISVAGVFLGESGSLGYYDGTKRVFHHEQVDLSAQTNDDNTILFKRTGGEDNIDAVPSYVSAINIYRSLPLAAAPSAPYMVEEDATLEFVGSISMADMQAGTPLQVMFRDYGQTRPDAKAMRRTPSTYAPRSKQACFHKGRLWWSSVRIDGTYYPDTIACSPNDENGTEPFVFFPEMTWAVGAGEPDEINVFKSLRNQALAIIKEDKTYAVLGADDTILGIPDVSIQPIDRFSGCFAPDSAVEVDGGALMFLSETDVMLWDGAAPRGIGEDAIKATLAKIPAKRRKDAVAGFNPKQREYDLFITLPEAGTSTYNRAYVRYNRRRDSWTAGRIQRGVSAVCAVNDADAQGYMLWGIEDTPLPTFASTPWVMRADSGYVEGIDATPDHQEQIAFEADFGYQDGGAPWLRKQWKEIALEFESQVPVTATVWVDGKGPYLQTNLVPSVDEDTLVWGSGAWGEKKWARSLFGNSRRVLTRELATLPKGNSIRLILSGTNRYQPVRIYSATVFYTPEES